MKHVYLLMMGAAIISLSPIFVKLIHLGPTWIAFWRTSVAALFLLSFSFKLPKRKVGKFLLWTAITGVVIALDLFVWHKSLIYIGAGLGTLLGNTQVIYMVIIGILFFNEKLSLRTFLAVSMAVIGITFLVAIDVPSDIGHDKFYWGVAFGLMTGIAYAVFMISLRKVERDFPELTTLQKLFWVYLFCSVLLLVISIFTKEVAMPSGYDFLWILLLGTLVNIGGWKLISSNLPKVSTAVAGLILLIQPAAATIWGVIFFNESLNLQQILGIVLLFFGIYISSVKR